MKLSETFALNVKKRLDAINLTKKDLAQLTSVSRNTINAVTSGKAKMIRFETIEEIARALRCKPQQLLDEETDWAIYKWAENYQRGLKHE